MLRKNSKMRWATAGVLVALFVLVSVSMTASTINGVANQILSGFAQYAVLVGAGTADIGTVAPSATAGYALVSNGSSANPSFQTVPNAGLTNSSVTVNTSAPLGGGGAVSLGGSLTLTCATCLVPGGAATATPGATPTWTVATGSISWTLSASATATVVVAPGDQWKVVYAHVCQPAAGGPYTLAWPSNVKGGFTITTVANKCNDQAFESPDGVNLYGMNTGIIDQ
jgi:hypothetical protein